MKKSLCFLLLAIGLSPFAFGQLTGVKTIPGSYATIAAAITDLNTNGVGAGGVTFNIAAGYTETFATPTAGNITTNTGTLANQIIFQKSGAGADPKITAATGTGTMDAIITFAGVQYVTFNGIDVYENAANLTATTQMEWGYAILKASATQGSQNITIKNCTISLNNTNTGSWGIYSNNHTAASTTQLTVTAVTGQNSNNKFYGNTITNCYNGIYLYGYSDATAPYLYYDQNNDIGSVTGNGINNFGGGANVEYMIYVSYQNGVTIANSNISGTSATGNGSIYGIYGGTSTNANASIYGNAISIVQTAATTGYIYGIYNTGLGTGGTTNTLNIYNNTVQNCQAPASTTSYFYGIYNSATAMTNNFYGNTVTNNVFGGSYYMYLCYCTSTAGGTSNVYNNTVTNNQRSGLGTQSGTSYLYCLYVPGSGTTVIHDNTISGNSIGPVGPTYGGYIYSIYASNSAVQQSVYNNSIHDQTITSSYTSSHAIYGIYSFPASSSTGTIYSNNVYNLTINSTSTGYGYIYGCYSYYGSSMYSNNVYGLAINASSTGYGYMYGLYSYYPASCYSNNVYNLSITNSGTGYGYGYGIYIGSSGVSNVYKNKLYNVSMAGTSGYFYGMYVTTGPTVNLYNNYISDLKAPASTSTTAVSGVYISGGTNVNLYYNTIYLNAQSTSTTTFGTNGIYASTTPTVELRNNIVVNTSSAPGSTTYVTAAYKRSSTTLTTYAGTSNNNDFYAGTPSATNLIYTDGTTNLQTMAAYKGFVSPRDAQTVTELPPFVNIATTPYDLHIKTTVATQCESGGSVVSTPVAITTDYDGSARYPNTGYPNNVASPATSPDMGANEFGGLLMDLTPPAINFSPLANTSVTTIRTLTTSITDQTGVPTSGAGLPRLYWKKNWVGTWNSVQATYGTGSTYTFTLGSGVALGDSVYYYLVAQDIVTPTPNIGATPSSGAAGYTANPPAVSTTPTTLYAYKIVPALCGSFNVGLGQTYPTLTAAITALNNAELTCPVTLVLTDASYSASETFPIVLGNVAGSSAVNTITIKPATGVTPTVSGSSASGIFVLMGTQYLTINGSNSGGTDQSLTFQQTNTVSNTYCVGIFNNGLVGASYCTIKNCKIMASSQVTNTTYALIFNGAGGGYTNDIIQNNQIYSAYEGVQLAGVSGNPASNCQVINNTIGSATDATALNKYGIFMAQADNCLVANNEIMGGPSGNTNYSQVGLYMSTGTTNAKIRANKIHDWSYSTLSGGWGCWGIYYAGDASTVNEISDNLVFNIKADSYTSGLSVDNLYGVYITSGGNIKFYHNTINMQGSFTSATYANATACLAINSGVTLMDVQNNIFKNSLLPGSGTPASFTYAIQCGGTASTFSNLNYNDYWVDGNGPNIGYLSGTQYANLAAWKTATSLEANGVNVNPLFTTATNLIPTTTLMNNGGIYIPLVPADFAGTLRSNPPDIGAYEFALKPLAITAAATAITSATATLNANYNANATTLNLFFDYGLTNAYGTSVAATPASLTGSTLTPGTYALAGLLPQTTYHFRARGVTTGGLIVYGSDMTFTTTALPPTVVTLAASAITGTTATLNGTVNANGSSSTISFDYGLTVAYGANVAGVPPTATGSTAIPSLYNLTGLVPNTLYHFRINGVNSGGTTNGSDLTFTTAAIAPTVTTTAATAITTNGATVNGTVNANNASTTVYFDYGLTVAYGTTVNAVPPTVTGTATTNVSAVLTSLTTATTYHYRVRGVNSAGTANGNDMTFLTGCPSVATAGAITGPASVCANSTGNVYTVGAITNAVSYYWSLPAGATITAGSGTNTITVTFGAASGTITVAGVGVCMTGTASSYNVTVNALPVPTIAGPASPCVNSTTNVYTTETGMTGYAWTVSAGGNITAGSTTSSITVTWTTTGAKTVTASYTNTNGCTAAAPTTYAVTVNALPVPTITGTASLCQGTTGVVYTTQAGMTNYVWTVSAGGTVTAGGTATSNTVTVTWNGAGVNTVTVNYANANGCVAATPASFSVTVNPTPVPTIGSNNAPCVGSTGNMYYTEGGMTGYVWTVSTGGTIVSGQGTSAINVTWTGVGAQWVKVSYTNATACTSLTPTTYNLFVNPMPNAAGAITGTATLCAGTSGVAYSCAEILNASTYTWTLPAGATIATGAGTKSITVNFATTAVSGNITVSGTNSCGNGTASPAFAVTVNPLPADAGTITGPASVCVGSTGVTYSVPTIANATSYVWTVPAGATITSGGTTRTIVVSYGATAGTGVVSVKGTNTCGNGAVSSLNVTIHAIPAAPVVTANGAVLTSSASAGNQWYYEGNAIAGATGQTYTVTHNTGYYWVVVTVNGCSSPLSNKVWVVMTGQAELNGSSFNVYPVPNDGRFTFTIASPVQETFTIVIYNQLGAKIYELGDVLVNGTFEKQVDLRPIANGIYSVVFLNSEHKVVKKVLVNK